MDLRTIYEKLTNDLYLNPIEFRDDIRLVWNNCRKFNPIGDLARRAGDSISEYFEKRWLYSRIEEHLANKKIKNVVEVIPSPEELISRIGVSNKNLQFLQNRMNTAYMIPNRKKKYEFSR
eukprot:gnl/TRDRNA2_/TRDRNA2_176459_c0_seq1.p1 gnl/TRDRNA2_/TRDRNA2_176459_c0~~gnl/TRDRNA2_/TRDRNA2_176459_c0_seq1.p1  ORF type:complete len:120 (-),score=2.42 gnl/TRDRNA2_/TRDRNA2_176459_c0_seq1:273-632(-)